jgi:hypothetical protein
MVPVEDGLGILTLMVFASKQHARLMVVAERMSSYFAKSCGVLIAIFTREPNLNLSLDDRSNGMVAYNIGLILGYLARLIFGVRDDIYN